MFRRIWNDPVGSQILGWIAIGILGIIGAWVWSVVKNIPYLEVFQNIYNYKVRLFWVVIVIIAFYLLRAIYKRNRKNPIVRVDPDKEIIKYNRRHDGDILWKYDVVTYAQSKPTIRNLTPYCKRHGEPPRKMSIGYSSFECPVAGCDRTIPTNEMYHNNTRQIQLLIESELEAKYEELHQKTVPNTVPFSTSTK